MYLFSKLLYTNKIICGKPLSSSDISFFIYVKILFRVPFPRNNCQLLLKLS